MPHPPWEQVFDPRPLVIPQPLPPRHATLATRATYRHPPTLLQLTTRRSRARLRGARPDRLWIGDITYVATWEGWLYVAVLLDAHSRRVIGWAMADHLRVDLALDALGMALGARRSAPGLVHHTDRGCQYTAGAYAASLAAHGVVVSMSRAGDCYDNAMAESFFATLKAELIDTQPWPTRRAAQQAIFEWIEVFYNRQRAHSALGYRSPVAYELALAEEEQAA
jgi:putative transposase